MAMDDEDEYYDIDDIEVLFEEEEYEEPVPNPGLSKWSLGWIALDAVSTLIHAVDHIIYNVKVDLVNRHNQDVDDATFIGSVEAGIERL